MSFPDRERRGELLAKARAAVAAFGLPLGRRSWKGPAGGWSGGGTGSSIDFQDHRHYFPGDDPRNINWRVWARTDQLAVRLFREEVRPTADILLDTSTSMIFEPGKAERTLELLFAALEAAGRDGCSARVFSVCGSVIHPLSAQQLTPARIGAELFGAPDGHAPEFSGLPLRPGSLRILISDLLYPGRPETCLRPMLSGGGHGVVLAPASSHESEPDWDGPIDLRDCESGELRRQSVDRPLLERYRHAYLQHFGLWTETSRRLGVAMALFPAEKALKSLLAREGLSSGVVEARR